MKHNPVLIHLLNGSPNHPDREKEDDQNFLDQLDPEEETFNRRYPYPRRYMKRYMIDLFSFLKREKHHIYVMLLNLPIECFAIVKYFDWRLYYSLRGKQPGTLGELDTPEVYSLEQFFLNRAKFHRYEEFTIYLFDQDFDYSNRLSIEKIEDSYLQLLYEICEDGLRKNRKFLLNREMASQYGLTRKDQRIVRELIDTFNSQAKTKIQQQYDSLAKLECIVK